MIDRYLDKGTMYVLDDDGIKAECVVTDEGNGILELNYSLLTPRRLRRELPTSTRTAFCLGKKTYTLSVGVNFRNSYGIFML